jgi:hypothetical protein
MEVCAVRFPITKLLKLIYFVCIQRSMSVIGVKLSCTAVSGRRGRHVITQHLYHGVQVGGSPKCGSHGTCLH